MKRNALPSLTERFVPSPQGPLPLAESAARCTRCNACVQSCPAYLIHREEIYSPRGRVQFIRLLAENKIKLQDCQPLIKKLTRTCLLCARCSAACAGQIPVAQFMLALRRTNRLQPLPKLLHGLLHTYGQHPRLLRLLAGAANTARRLGLVFLLKYSGLLLLPPLRWMIQADRVLPRKTGNLRKTLHKKGISLSPKEIDFIYLPSPLAQYADETIGLLSLKALNSPRIHILLDTSCGLFESVYGRRSLGIRQARKLITRWEELSANKNIPLVTDSIELFSFLKNYPVLFAKTARWRKRAEKLAKHVHFIAEYIKPASGGKGMAVLDISGAFYPAGEATEKAHKILKTHFGKNMLECEYSRFPLPAAAEAFTVRQAAEETALESVKDIARHQIQYVYCLSVWSALGLESLLCRHYPKAKALHIVHLQVEP